MYEQYILETFGSATEPHGKNRNLDYEIEYMISGKSSDEENLRSVVRQLFCFRLAMNYVYLLSDAKKQGEAEALALALAAVALHPEAAEGLKQILLLLWCFGESVMDLRALLSGKRAALMKSEETWQLSLESVFRIGSGEDGMEGMDAVSYTHLSSTPMTSAISKTLRHWILSFILEDFGIRAGEFWR